MLHKLCQFGCPSGGGAIIISTTRGADYSSADLSTEVDSKMDSYLCFRLNEKIRSLSNELRENEQVLRPSRKWEWTDTLTAEAFLLQLDCLIAIIRDRSRFANQESNCAPLQEEDGCPANNIIGQSEYLSVEQEQNFIDQLVNTTEKLNQKITS